LGSRLFPSVDFLGSCADSNTELLAGHEEYAIELQSDQAVVIGLIAK